MKVFGRFTAGLLLVGASATAGLAAGIGDGKATSTKPAAGEIQPDDVLLGVMQQELARAMSLLGNTTAEQAVVATAGAGKAGGKGEAQPQPKPYFVSYAVADVENISMLAQFGAISREQAGRRRVGDIQVRIGSEAEDNTHGTHRNSALMTVPLPLADKTPAEQQALAASLWYATNRGYGRALDSFLQVKTEQQVRAKEEDSSADFSRDTPATALVAADADFAPSAPLLDDKRAWEGRLRELSAVFKEFPDVFSNQVQLEASNEVDYFVSSQGAKVAAPSHVARLVIVGRTRAADGMDLYRVETFESDRLGRLPDQATLMTKTRALAMNLEALRTAPITEPFNGPAILSGRASAVFFHEVLGHRLEGQRQKGDEEGQTFTKLLNKSIVPPFISVADDPTLASFEGQALSGHYLFDNEGQPAQRVQLIKDGILDNFLMSRLPIASFQTSNGHGRAEIGHMPTGRQGNLIVTSTKTVGDAELREMLKAEAKAQAIKQGKDPKNAYGLYFEDISSGFAVTTRRSPQAFSVIPLVVYRVYVDGRADELVRGVSIVGTPQAALNRIVATGNKPDIFNGICGAESGSIPVSAVAPAMLVSEIETQRQSQGTTRPPILPPPVAGRTDARAVAEVGR